MKAQEKTKEEKDKKMENTMKKFLNTKAQIWGNESHACTIVYEVSTRKYRAECGLDSRILNEKNYERVLNDMFYDYCVENAEWMGVS